MYILHLALKKLLATFPLGFFLASEAACVTVDVVVSWCGFDNGWKTKVAFSLWLQWECYLKTATHSFYSPKNWQTKKITDSAARRTLSTVLRLFQTISENLSLWRLKRLVTLWIMPWFHVHARRCNFCAIIAGFPTWGKTCNLCTKLQRVTCNKLHMKPLLYRRYISKLIYLSTHCKPTSAVFIQLLRIR